MLHRKGKGKEAKLAYLGHVLLDNRQGLVANVCATHATGTAEREAAALLLEASAPPGSTVGADKGYDVASFVADVRIRKVTPHVAQKVRWSAIDGRTTRHAGYHVSQRKRKLVEQVFGWMKTVGGLRKLDIAASHSWIGSSPSPPRPITWSGCGIWRRRVPGSPVARVAGPLIGASAHSWAPSSVGRYPHDA